MSILSHISNLILASNSADKEDRQLKREYCIDTSIGANLFDTKSIKWAFADRPKVKEIETYLNELDYDTLLKLETIMYFGRRVSSGEIVDLEILRSYLSGLNDSKEELIRTIVEKRGAYPIYFRMACQYLEENGIDIDSL